MHVCTVPRISEAVAVSVVETRRIDGKVKHERRGKPMEKVQKISAVFSNVVAEVANASGTYTALYEELYKRDPETERRAGNGEG